MTTREDAPHHTQPATPRLLVTFEQAAEALGGLSRSMIYRLVWTKQLRSVSVGRRHLIVARSLQEYVQRLEAGEGGDE